MNIYDIIKEPIITEKSTQMMQEQNKYTFEVDRSSTKSQVKKAFIALFGITPKAINIVYHKAQNVKTGTKFPGRSKNCKKAIITLSKDQQLNLMGEQSIDETKKDDKGIVQKLKSAVTKDITSTNDASITKRAAKSNIKEKKILSHREK